MNELDRYRDALWRIAEEQRVYMGHGDYDMLPMLSAEEAQSLARHALMCTGPYLTIMPRSWDAPVEQAARGDFARMDAAIVECKQNEGPWGMIVMVIGGLTALGFGAFVRWLLT